MNDDSKSAGGVAIFVLLTALIAGVIAGVAIGAVKVDDGGSFYSNEWALMLEQPLTGTEKTFNWLLFCLFAAAGIVAAAAAWAGTTAANAVRHAESAAERRATRTNPGPPPLPPMGSTPPVSDPLNPPYL